MSFLEIVRQLGQDYILRFINRFVADQEPGEEPGIMPGKEPEEPGKQPDPDDMKAERTQWERWMHGDWQKEANGKSIYRTIVCIDAEAARDLNARIDAELVSIGYKPDTVDVLGNVLAVRLTTASVGELMNHDFAAAVVIDTCV